MNFDSIIYSRIPNRILSAIFGAPFSLGYPLFFRKHFGKATIRVETIDSPDERIDAIWEKNKTGYRYAYVKKRDYMNWRFVDNPENYDF